MSESNINPVSVPDEEAELKEEELESVTGGADAFTTNTAPSASVGTDKSIRVGKATTRQTFSDTLSSKIVQGGGSSTAAH